MFSTVTVSNYLVPHFSYFQTKLFNEWYPTWTEEEQHRLIKGVTDMDAVFGRKLQELITNGPQLNGDSNGTNGIHYDDADEIISVPANSGAALAIAEESVEGLAGEEKVSDNNIPIEIAAHS